jgi:phage shock protein A
MGGQGGRCLATRRGVPRLRQRPGGRSLHSLARQALKRQLQLEEQVRTLDGQVAAQSPVADKLKGGLSGLKGKREELVSKREELVARAKMARAQAQVQYAIKSVNIMDPTSELARFEERIRRVEARATGMAEIAASSLDGQFKELEILAGDVELDARLAALKRTR